MRQVNIAAALELYYERLTLSNKDIKNIFGVTSDSTASKIKNEVICYFAESDINPISALNGRIKTEYAFEAWGIDIKNLEMRFRKLQKINAAPGNSVPKTAKEN